MTQSENPSSKDTTITAEVIAELLKNGSLIAKGCRFKGELVLEGGIKIDGELEGSVLVNGPAALVYVSETGRVTGEIRAANVVIDGQVKGQVRADHRATVYGKLEGDIYYGEKLVVEESADINGRVARLSSLKEEAPPRAAGSGLPFSIAALTSETAIPSFIGE